MDRASKLQAGPSERDIAEVEAIKAQRHGGTLTFVVNASDTMAVYDVIVPAWGNDNHAGRYGTLDGARQEAERLYADGKRRTLVWKIERVTLGDGWRAERETLVLELVLRI